MLILRRSLNVQIYCICISSKQMFYKTNLCAFVVHCYIHCRAQCGQIVENLSLFSLEKCKFYLFCQKK